MTTMQSAELGAAFPSLSPSHSQKSGTTAHIVVAACQLAAAVALGLLGHHQSGTGGSRAGADGSAVQMVGL
jgi:hypothetical protein